jgi:predicted metalloprotease with PDZ domain
VDDRIILGDVAKGSPADEAGLKEGDMVVGINTMLGQGIQKYKTVLQNIGEKIKMIVSRNGELMEFNFKVKSIL